MDNGERDDVERSEASADRFEEVKKFAGKDDDYPSMFDAPSVVRAMRWLISEVERLRKIENAAGDWVDDLPDEPSDHYGEALVNAIFENPRPGTDGQ